jgi:hypothetical protein
MSATPLFLDQGPLSGARHWGVAARVYRGACVNVLGLCHGPGGLIGLARPLASALSPGSGGGRHAKAFVSHDPDGALVEAVPMSTVVVGLAEIGDKTQIATIGLARAVRAFLSALGMMLANVPAVLIGDRIAEKLPERAIRITAAGVFAVLGLLIIARADG